MNQNFLILPMASRKIRTSKVIFRLSTFFSTFWFSTFWSFDVLIILKKTFDVLTFRCSDRRRSDPLPLFSYLADIRFEISYPPSSNFLLLSIVKPKKNRLTESFLALYSLLLLQWKLKMHLKTKFNIPIHTLRINFY